jgi:hypothetical protein
MKELEDHLQLVCQMIEDEYCDFHSFLQEIKKRTEWLSWLPPGQLETGEKKEWEWEKRP